MLKQSLFLIILIMCFNALATTKKLNPSFFSSDDKAFKKLLIENKITLKEWIDKTNRQKDGFYCLGETHYDSYREFVSENIFPHLKMDKLLLEDTPAIVKDLIKQHNETGDAELAGANLSIVLKSALQKNPDIEIIGVDETEEQELAKLLFENREKRHFYTRDGYIAQNITEVLEKNKVHFALYGSNHCAKNGLALGGTGTFYRHLLKQKTGPVQNIKSVLLVQNHRGDYYADYMWLLGLNKEVFVIPDTSKIPESSYNYNWKLKKYFNNYDTIIFFM